ncbi:hypothetical protein FRC00_000053 [Tulasnella sp. 408]|nr:hypothetical protein FRC00_000053 [Tulasnella sp. 408]
MSTEGLNMEPAWPNEDPSASSCKSCRPAEVEENDESAFRKQTRYMLASWICPAPSIGRRQGALEDETSEDEDEEEDTEENPGSVVVEADAAAESTHSTTSTSAPPQPSAEDEKNLRASLSRK